MRERPKHFDADIVDGAVGALKDEVERLTKIVERERESASHLQKALHVSGRLADAHKERADLAEARVADLLRERNAATAEVERLRDAKEASDDAWKQCNEARSKSAKREGQCIQRADLAEEKLAELVREHDGDCGTKTGAACDCRLSVSASKQEVRVAALEKRVAALEAGRKDGE